MRSASLARRNCISSTQYVSHGSAISTIHSAAARKQKKCWPSPSLSPSLFLAYVSLSLSLSTSLPLRPLLQSRRKRVPRMWSGRPGRSCGQRCGRGMRPVIPNLPGHSCVRSIGALMPTGCGEPVHARRHQHPLCYANMTPTSYTEHCLCLIGTSSLPPTKTWGLE